MKSGTCVRILSRPKHHLEKSKSIVIDKLELSHVRTYVRTREGLGWMLNLKRGGGRAWVMKGCGNSPCRF